MASEGDARNVMTDELALDVFNQCGITAVLDVRLHNYSIYHQ